MSTVRSPKTPSPFALPASDLLFPEKTRLLAFPLHSDESQCSFLVTLKADMVPFIGEWLIPNPNLNCVVMHNQPDSHYVGPNFSLFSLVTNNPGGRLILLGQDSDSARLGRASEPNLLTLSHQEIPRVSVLRQESWLLWYQTLGLRQRDIQIPSSNSLTYVYTKTAHNSQPYSPRNSKAGVLWPPQHTHSIQHRYNTQTHSLPLCSQNCPAPASSSQLICHIGVRTRTWVSLCSAPFTFLSRSVNLSRLPSLSLCLCLSRSGAVSQSLSGALSLHLCFCL